MLEAVTDLIDIIEEAGLDVSIHSNSDLLHLRFPGDLGIMDVYVYLIEPLNVLGIYATSFFRAEPAHRAEVAQLLAITNYGLNLGGFEMDMSDGEVRFRISLLLDDVEMSSGHIRKLIGIATATYDHYFRSIVRVSLGDLRPEDADSEARLLTAVSENAVTH